jgi:acyl-CoA reductase-like NAD-dependent aldehyde dehydrogenase
MLPRTHKILIGGKWVTSVSGETFPSLNPATEKPIGRFQSGTGTDVDRAVEAAQAAFLPWSRTPAPKRALILLRFAGLLRSRKEPLARLLTREMGKVLPEARGDVQEAIDTAEYISGEGRRLFGRTTPSELPSKSCMTVRRPFGVVGCITPWNFPYAIPSWKLMPALACGNSVVFKPASDTPLTAIAFVRLLEKAGLPPGVLNLVTGAGGTVGGAIVKHPAVRAISFTGSREAGLSVGREAGLKKVSLELGGKNAVIVMDDADLDLALDGVLWGAYGTTGQRCTATSRVIVHEKVLPRFEDMLVSRIRKLRLGNGLSKVDVGPMISRKAVEKVQEYVSLGLSEGARLLAGGRAPGGRGFFYRPTLFTNVSPGMRIAQEEIFGPVLCLLTVSSFDEAIEAANSVDYGLSSAIYTNDIRNAHLAIERLEAGITYVNSPTIGAEVHLPFGGIKGTGYGKEAGWTAIEEFSFEKTVYVDYSGRLQKAQMDG